MTKKKISTDISSENHPLLSLWINEVKNNPHFKQELAHADIQKPSHKILSELLKYSEENTSSTIEKKDIKPVLDLWHGILEDKEELGLSSKDIAILLFSLKSSLLNQSELASKLPQQLHTAVDILGVLTFELYSAEKEHLLQHQAQHIKYLTSLTRDDKKLNIIGNSKAMQSIFDAIRLIVDKDISVLLEGESGTGKDLIATLIHQHSDRKDASFIVVNCASIPAELIESELFGHEQGAFTGADHKKLGKFELANNGTLFLDEIGELPYTMQAKLLRALQNQEIERVGSETKIKINTRIIAATNQDLQEMVNKKEFRLDLYYRINVFPIFIPPLRERKEDILPLAQHFIDIYAQKFHLSKKVLGADAESYLLAYHWPGNIRELENRCQRAVIISPDNYISSTAFQIYPGKNEEFLLPEKISPQLETNSTTTIPLETMEKEHIRRALQNLKGNLKKTAEQLEISRTTLYNKIKKYNLPINHSE